MKPIILFIFFIGLFSSGCLTEKDGKSKDTIYKSIFGERILLYEKLDVTAEWKEINLIQPVNDGGRIYHTILKMEQWNDWQNWQVCTLEYMSEKPREYWYTHLCDNIVNPQGMRVNLEIEMIDEKGNSYKLYPFAANDEGIKFTFNREIKKGAVAREHTTFTRMRIRSGVPLKVSQIIWKRYQV